MVMEKLRIQFMDINSELSCLLIARSYLLPVLLLSHVLFRPLLSQVLRPVFRPVLSHVLLPVLDQDPLLPDPLLPDPFPHDPLLFPHDQMVNEPCPQSICSPPENSLHAIL